MMEAGRWYVLWRREPRRNLCVGFTGPSPAGAYFYLLVGWRWMPWFEVALLLAAASIIGWELA